MKHTPPPSAATYIHGTTPSEQERLALLNRLTNGPFIEFLALTGGERVLEIGSGLGILAREIAGRLPHGSLIGVEFASVQLAQARRSPATNLAYCRADGHALPLRDSSFDVVYCRYLLEHVADPLQVLREARRVLRRGGRIQLQENNILVFECFPECPLFAALWKSFAELQSRLGGDALIGRRLLPLLRRAGFRDIKLSVQPEVHYSGKPSFQPWVENIALNLEGGAKKLIASGLATEEELRSAVQELRAFMQLPDASTFFYWNRARALK